MIQDVSRLVGCSLVRADAAISVADSAVARLARRERQLPVVRHTTIPNVNEEVLVEGFTCGLEPPIGHGLVLVGSVATGGVEVLLCDDGLRAHVRGCCLRGIGPSSGLSQSGAGGMRWS